MTENTASNSRESLWSPVWIVALFSVWGLFGVAPLALALVGKHWFALADGADASLAGTIGDSFGLVNSLFSGAALIFVVWSIRLQQQEIRAAQAEVEANAESQRIQAETMRHTARLTAINHIYAHYGNDYGRHDATGILQAVALGHRRWAVRESFDSVDGLFSDDRVAQVQRDADQLAELLMVPTQDVARLQEIAWRLSSLLVEARLSPAFRKSMWRLYELLRQNPPELVQNDSLLFKVFADASAEAVAAWRSSRSRDS